MNVAWHLAHIESEKGLWFIVWPDGSKAWFPGFKTKGWATRTLNYLLSTKAKP